MSENKLENKEYVKDKDKSWKIPPKLKNWIDMKMVIILGIVGKMAWDMFTTGAEFKYQIHFQETLKTDGAKNIIHEQITNEIDGALEDKNFLAKVFSADGIINEIDKQISRAKQHIVDEVFIADSSKIDFVGTIAVGADLRDESIMPMLIDLVVAIKEGDLIFRDDIEDVIEDEVERRLTRTVRADF